MDDVLNEIKEYEMKTIQENTSFWTLIVFCIVDIAMHPFFEDFRKI